LVTELRHFSPARFGIPGSGFQAGTKLDALLPAILDKAFIRLLPPSGIRRDKSAFTLLWRDVEGQL
jgi:hypothetical protein